MLVPGRAPRNIEFHGRPLHPKAHNTDGLNALTFIVDDVLRYPEVSTSNDPADAKAARFFRMVSSQRLQIAAAIDLLARLRILAYHVVIVNIVPIADLPGA
jgi:hypothetical protein